MAVILSERSAVQTIAASIDASRVTRPRYESVSGEKSYSSDDQKYFIIKTAKTRMMKDLRMYAVMSDPAKCVLEGNIEMSAVKCEKVFSYLSELK